MSTITETMTTMPTINEQNGNTTSTTTTTTTKKDQAPSQIDETTFIKTTTISSSSKSSTSSSTSTSNGHPALTANGNSLTPNTEQPEQLKIIGHLKNIELINEQRRVFLNNTVSSETSREQERQLLETTQSETLPNGDVLQRQQSERTSIIRAAENGDSKGDEREHVVSAKVTIVPANQTVNPKAAAPQTPIVAPLKSPMTPPPKPPMLSRTRSVGQGDNRASIQSITSPTSPTAPILSTTVTTTTLAEPAHVQTIQVEAQQQSAGVKEEETDSTDTAIAEVKLRRPAAKQQQQAEIAKQMEANCNAEKPITSKHYEHLIEELKCPGCAIPMKAPILLCETGHSICEQCTRILMMCPLCKEPFTKIRSHTVEALCSKAHFRCVNAPGGCTVRLQKDLLTWHEKQCVYKPMKCFMGRVWGDCQWDGREIQWKEHLETEHANRVFQAETMDLIWNMGVKQKPLTGYYVFEAFDEMFNFYAIHDKERILYTMTCTSSVKEKKHHFAYEVTMIHPCNEALAITQKFPVHSEYDSDILMEGTCVSITLSDLAKFIDDEKLLHYRVRIMQVNSPRKSKAFLHLPLATAIPKDFQNTQIAGVNLKSVPSDIILTRREDLPLNGNGHSPALSTNSHEPPSTSEDEVEKIRREYNRKIHEDGDSESDPEFEAFIAKRWGTPQLHFNRKYLKNISSDSSSNGEHYKNGDSLGRMQDDRVSIASTNVSYKKRMSNTLRKSFRSLKSEFNGMKAFGKKSPEKILTE